jgi:diguanylate cyclase (GGDEF)-like protein
MLREGRVSARFALGEVMRASEDRLAATSDHPRFRIARVRAVRSAVSRATLVLAAISVASGAPLILIYPRDGLVLAIVGGIEAGMWLAIAVIVRWVPRRAVPPLVGVAAMMVLPGPLLTIVLLPTQYATTLAYLALLPLGVALFIPWSPRSHGGWLAGYLTVTWFFAASPLAAGLTSDERLGLVIATGLTAAVSLVGQRTAERSRARAFAEDLRLRALNVRERAQGAELDRLNRALAATVRQDPLTGLANRLRLNEDLTALWDRHVRYGHQHAAVMLDLDRFKSLNDRYGHLAGDSALRAVAAILSDRLRPSDCAYRLGGEEFLVVLDEATIEEADAVAGRIIEAVAALAIPNPDNVPWGVLTISAGIAVTSDDGVRNAESWLGRADAALYRAKAAGRNRALR